MVLERRWEIWPPKGKLPPQLAPRERLQPVQGPKEVAGRSGTLALLKELRSMVVGDDRAIALHRLDLNDPLEKYLVERPRWLLRGHGDQARSSMTSAAASPLQ